MEILDQPRQVTSDWHIGQAHRLLRYDAGRELDTVLVYAALELRLAIERRFLEVVALLNEGELTAAAQKRCRSLRGLDLLVREIDPHYRKTIEFTRIIASTEPGMPEVGTVDLRYMKTKWHELSEYCHLQLQPASAYQSAGREFQRRGFVLVRDVLARFMACRVVAAIARSSMPVETRSIYDRFVRGEVDADQARRMLILIAPTIERGLRVDPRRSGGGTGKAV